MIVCPDCSNQLPALDAGQCEHCGRVFEHEEGIPTLLSSDDLAEPIARAYRDHYDDIARDDLAEGIQIEDHMVVEADRLLETVGDVHGLAVCDVGVGKGMLLERLAAASPRSLIGVDLALPYLRRLGDREGVRLVRADAERLPFRSEFDVLVSSDVLEHVLNVGDFLHSVREAIRPGGRFVVRVPHMDSLTSYASQNGYRYRFAHLRAFDGRSLKRLLQEAGFDVARLRYSSFYATRRRRLFGMHPKLDRTFQHMLVSHYGGAGKVNRIDPRLGRLAMNPNVVTAVAVRRP
jgi:2-polyprenyl-3-methyl-5-hydroxy-6-metoxy-1,4-benzoquinol methylase